MKLTVEQIAYVCHEQNRAYCGTTGDDSQQPWDEAPRWQRDSVKAGVRFLATNPFAGPRDAHAAWARKKLEEGWRYGPVKDAKRKEHPCLVPYDELPAEQRIKDRLFHDTCRTLLRLE